MVYFNAAIVVTHCLGLSRGDTMLNTENILKLSEDELYSLYLKALKDRDLPMLNSVRSIIADRYCISELKKSPLDEPFSNPLVKRFFSVK